MHCTLSHSWSLTILLCLFVHFGYSQTLSKIFVYDREFAIPIEDANVKLRNGTILSTDKYGVANISLLSPDTVTISHITYNTLTTIVGVGFPDTIYLNSQLYKMEPVSISANKHLKRIGSTTQKEKNYGIIRAYGGNEAAQKFKLSDVPARLFDLKFHILEISGADSLLVKASFFYINDGMPGKKSVKQQIVFMVNQNKDVSVDLSPYNIVLNEDFILSLQIMKVYSKTKPEQPPYIKIPVKIDLVGQIFTRSFNSGWDKKKGGSLGINLLIGY